MSDKIEGRADMAMYDLNYPYFNFGQFVYFAHSHDFIVSGEPGNTDRIGYYYGSAYNDQEKREQDPKRNTTLQCTFWPSSNELETSILWAHPTAWRTYVVGENAACGAVGFDEIKNDRWYRHVCRYWAPSDPIRAKQYSHMAWWTRDLENDGPWKLLIVAEVPLKDARFKNRGLGGFIETHLPLGSDNTASQKFRNLYTHRDGQWAAADRFQITFKGYQTLKTDPTGREVTYEVRCKPTEQAPEPTTNPSIALNQPESPELGTHDPVKATATHASGQLLIEWESSHKSTPFLSARIEGLDASGAVVITKRIDSPHIHRVLLDVDPDTAKSIAKVRITTRGIFDREASATCEVDAPQSVRRIDAVPDQPIEPGLVARFFVDPDAKPDFTASRLFTNWDELPNTDELTLARTAFVREPSLEHMPQTFGLVTRTEGFLKIEQSGIYILHFTACDGGKLSLHGQVLIDQNIHNSGNEMSQWVYLEAGLHPVVMAHYSDIENPKPFLEPRLALEYEGPGITRSPVPESAWKRSKGSRPLVQWDIDAQVEGNIATINLGKAPDGLAKVERVELIGPRGEVWLDLLKDEVHGAHTLFMPEGEHALYLRVYFDNLLVLDLNPITVAVKNPPVKGWTMAPAGRTVRPSALIVTPDAITMMGDGTRWATRRITGDFVYKMRFVSFENQVVNHAPLASSTVYARYGFFATSPKDKPTFEYGKGFKWYRSQYFGPRFDTPLRNDHGLSQTNWQNSHHQTPDGPYEFRFTRRGDYFSAEVRPEGGEWKLVLEETTKLPDELDIGPYMFYASTDEPDEMWRVKFDQISIEQGEEAKN